MQSALVLITVEPTQEGKVIEKLRGLSEVVEVHLLYGPYDMYVKIESRTGQEIQNIIFDEIRNISGIKSTMTCFIAD